MKYAVLQRIAGDPFHRSLSKAGNNYFCAIDTDKIITPPHAKQAAKPAANSPPNQDLAPFLCGPHLHPQHATVGRQLGCRNPDGLSGDELAGDGACPFA